MLDHSFTPNPLPEAQGKCAEAEPLYKRALAARENTLGTEHPDVASSLRKLAGLWAKQARTTSSIFSLENCFAGGLFVIILDRTGVQVPARAVFLDKKLQGFGSQKPFIALLLREQMHSSAS